MGFLEKIETTKVLEKYLNFMKSPGNKNGFSHLGRKAIISNCRTA